MSNSKITPGSRYVPEFQISGLPFLTRSVSSTTNNPQVIEFPYLTQWIMVNPTNNTTTYVQFASHSLANNPNSFRQATTTLDSMKIYFIRTKKLYVTTGFFPTQPVYIIAGLTGIDSGYEYIKPADLAAISASFDLASTNYYSYGGL